LLADARVRTAKPRAKSYKLTDSNSLFLLVTPSEGRLWRWNCAYDGRQKSIAFSTARGLAGCCCSTPTNEQSSRYMTTRHLGEKGVQAVVASAARELLNKADNERSGVLSTAMSFLVLYRDPVVAQVTGASDWRITDLVDGARPASLYLVVPPSDISRTKPLIRLILNQIGRRLTEELTNDKRRHCVLLMLDELPALGRPTSSRAC
jgi:type IV secretion system protein VirD4